MRSLGDPAPAVDFSLLGASKSRSLPENSKSTLWHREQSRARFAAALQIEGIYQFDGQSIYQSVG
jgi:hypothetical protein